MRLARHDIGVAAGSEDLLQALAHAAGEKVRSGMAVAELQDRQPVSAENVRLQFAIGGEPFRTHSRGVRRGLDLRERGTRAHRCMRSRSSEAPSGGPIVATYSCTAGSALGRTQASRRTSARAARWVSKSAAAAISRALSQLPLRLGALQRRLELRLRKLLGDAKRALGPPRCSGPRGSTAGQPARPPRRSAGSSAQTRSATFSANPHLAPTCRGTRSPDRAPAVSSSPVWRDRMASITIS